ncbi:hypothetical protein [Jeotgalibacillus campisalis]|uniref:Uncharacterized protein n=1 Tax=Jeotgalibacillus campisalis TaxID=220754 RepID=A0A0C2VG73_9BACL|nr:hypothetical protein [Jeotgalibacillus campisalis]KIL47887.1 hypothetical protein KR50_20540 [Jeotgalibacillus campisalis]
MWNQLVEEQLLLQSEIAARNKLIRRKEILEEKLHSQKRKKEHLYQLLTREQQDIHDLDHFSFINLFREVTGKKEEIREKELAQAAEAEIKLNEAEKLFHNFQADYEELMQKLQNPRWIGLDQEWELLMEKKENWLRSYSHIQSQQLDSLQRIQRELDSLLVEINEALEAGKKVNLKLKKAYSHMQSAKDLSTWDTFLGGGLIATAMKHSKLDDSEDAIHTAQLELQRFETELQDINDLAADGLTIERGAFLTFADYFFDDLFSEWTVHSSISKTMDNLQNVIGSVEKTCAELTEQSEKIANQQTKVSGEMDSLIQGMELY